MKRSFYNLFLCMTVLPARMEVYHTCKWCLQRSEEGVGTLRRELEMVVSHPVDAVFPCKSYGCS